MTRRGRRVTLATGAWLIFIGTPLVAQTEGTLSLGASVVEYEGFLTSKAVVFAPALRFDSHRLSFAGQGSWTAFESGRDVIQGSAAAAWLAGTSRTWRVELSGSAGASQYAAQPMTGHLLGGARLHVFATNSGGWIGFNAGGSFGGPTGVPLELMAAGWSVRNRLALVGTARTTWRGPVRHLDLVGAARWTGSVVELEARAGIRPWVEDGGSGDGAVAEAYGEITALAPLSRWLSVSMSGGKYPSDPVRQILGAAYVSAGIRLRAFGRAGRTGPGPTIDVLRGRLVPTEASVPPLEIEGSAERKTLRVRAPGATSVEIMGDFTDWVPVRLVRVTPGVWEISLVVPAGVHRVNIRLDGGPWAAPGGARLERTEFGGAVGIVVVP